MLKQTRLRTASIVLVAACAAASQAQQEGRPGGRPGPEQFVERMMANDTNGDGKLSREELPGPFAERMFDGGDADGDGLLNESELRAAYDRFMAERGRPGAERGPRQADGPRGVRPGGVRPADDAAAEPAPMDFHGSMEAAGRSFRSLRRSPLTAESAAEDLKHIDRFQHGLMTAKLRMADVPMADQARERFGEDKARYSAEFRMTLVQTIMEALTLEMAVLQGDTEAAKASINELVELQKQSHDLFQQEEDEDEAGAKPVRARPNRPSAAPGGRD